MPKGTSPDKAMSLGTKIEFVPLAIVELHLFEGVSQIVSQSVRWSVSRKFR